MENLFEGEVNEIELAILAGIEIHEVEEGFRDLKKHGLVKEYYRTKEGNYHYIIVEIYEIGEEDKKNQFFKYLESH